MPDEPANQLIKADGTSEEFLPADGKHFTLEEMQTAVGGYIERVRLRDGRYMLVDEDAQMKGSALNTVASSLCRTYIRGDVMVCEPKYFDDPEEEDESE